MEIGPKWKLESVMAALIICSGKRWIHHISEREKKITQSWYARRFETV